MLDAEAARCSASRPGRSPCSTTAAAARCPAQLGVLFGARKRYTRPLRVQMAIQKPLYHLARSRSLGGAAITRRRSTSRAARLPIERDSVEGERLMLATVMAMNYGFAFRLCDLRDVDARLARRRWARRGRGWSSTRRITRSTRSRSAAERAIVHRHNAARAYPGLAHGAPPGVRTGSASRCCCPAPAGPPPTCASPARARSGACTRRPTVPARRSTSSPRTGRSAA